MKKIIYTVFTLGLGASQLEAQPTPPSIPCVVARGQDGCQYLPRSSQVGCLSCVSQAESLLLDLGEIFDSQIPPCPSICSNTSPCSSTCTSLLGYVNTLNSPTQTTSTFGLTLADVCIAFQQYGQLVNVCSSTSGGKISKGDPIPQDPEQKRPAKRL